ncbi:hypothetical protein FA95DRAFT_1564258 [Auriscalpium vulgare]|uniref:Uncharacterized protein n=1 Tax=Auriscalpium vulgare TaxID=40419 RepID=A0ACB8RFZ3_9AGAM|nr:hypothetical protein FA95DRAFT_1564258 [Auriscalpium vulgare]
MFSASHGELAEAQHSLRKNPAATITRARNGSLLALDALSVDIIEVPAIRTMATLRLFCSILSASNVPSQPLPSSPSTSAMFSINRAFFSLRGISRMIKLPYDDNMMADAWPIMFTWLRFFNMLADVNHPVLRDDVLEVLGLALLAFASPSSSLFSHVLATSGVMELAASMWLKESEHRMPAGVAVCSASVNALLFYDHDGDMLDEFVQHAGGWAQTSDIAAIAVSRLRGAVPNAVPPLWQIEEYINVMSALSWNGVLCFSILNSGGVRIVIRALTGMADLHHLYCEEEFGGSLYRSMEVCVSYIVQVIDAGDGLPWVRQAVRTGLLDLCVGLAKINAWMPTSLQKNLLRLVAKLAPYFIYHSVFSLCTASYSDAPTIWNVIPNSLLKTSLEKVYRRAAHHTQLAQHWEAFKDIAYCDNCEKNESKHALKWCAGCRSVFYCSKECQKVHWQMIHRVQCELRRAYRTDPIRQPPSKADRRFHSRYVIYNAIESLEKLRASSSSSEPLSDIGIFIDYTEGEPSYSTYPLKHYTVKIDNYLVREILEQARSDKGRTSLIESRMALGDCTRIFFTLVAPPIWDAQDGWLDALDFRIVNVAAGDITRRGASPRSGARTGTG